MIENSVSDDNTSSFRLTPEEVSVSQTLLDDPKGERCTEGILSSETENSNSRKFEQSSGRLAQVAAGGPVLVGSPTLSFDAEETE